jgi:hypothetical protein
MVTIIDLKINITGLNKSNRYQHWGKSSTIANRQRNLAAIVVANNRVLGKISSHSPRFIISFIRSGKRLLDNDNLIGGLKHIRDGVCDAIGINDGSDKIEFRYTQRKEPFYKLRIEIDDCTP